MQYYTGHPEAKEGEVCLRMVGQPYFESYSAWKTRRAGKVVMRGEHPFVPVFVKLSEIQEKYPGCGEPIQWSDSMNQAR